ncbi:MAG: hypothetical protein HC927_08455 [Deltaproteobacteria bacterium]|nr:hypothetical protein [Deltaproteobacteria bacterium]
MSVRTHGRLMMQTSRKLLLLAALTATATSVPAQQNLFFFEDWESFPLFPSIDEPVTGGQSWTFDLGNAPLPDYFFGDAVDSIPFDGQWVRNGWTMTFNLPGIGTAEWQGFSITTVANWVQADTQLRGEFKAGPNGEISTSKIAVADPDEWDDYPFEGINPDGDGRRYVSELTSPRVSIAGVDAGTLVIQFASSWRPETVQTAEVRVSYDDAPFEVVSRFTSVGTDEPWTLESPFGFKPNSTNELLTLPLNNPIGANQVRVQFAIFDAVNNWWWAVDDISILGEGGTPLAGPPAAFTLTTPARLSTVPTLSWTVSGNALEYDIEIANDELFTNPVFIGISGGTSLQVPAGVLSNGVYYLKVTARNSEGTVERTQQIIVNNANPYDLDNNGVVDMVDNLLYLNFVDRAQD